jgi:flagellar basal-body rod protein FlgB
MISALFNQPNYLAAKRLLDLSALRHEAIAANLQNIETPGYRRIDVSPAFEAQLREAVASRDAQRIASFTPQLATDASAVSGRRDGNNVELEGELLRLSRNQVEYAAEAQFITASLLKMRLAITGRPV